MSTESARENLKSLLVIQVSDEHSPFEFFVRPIFIVRTKNVKDSTSKRVRYFIAPGGRDVNALQDITGRVASAVNSFNKYNDRTGDYLVKGGDGSETINSLSIALFDDHKLIPVFQV